MSSWTRGSLAALAVCALLLAGPAGCGPEGAHGPVDGKPPEPVGKLLDHTDEEGRRYREVDRKSAPEVRVEVRPDTDGDWDVRLAVRRFRFSPDGTARATAGRGLAQLLVDGRLVVRLRAPEYRLSGRFVPHGTHHVTVRLYADDGTVWAVGGRPVQSTADITAAPPEAAEAPEPPEPSRSVSPKAPAPAASPKP
ncbi:hypothetical protein ACWDAO_34780 [Streptomyces sp. NPDC001212]|uniref:hypothetical protein n=1 Tax=Streptomyces sp. HYC2 TaxID=2955207 RepID=UPI00247FAA0F|nr:hypothetical protein [Streptomyces sp. HYC2]